MCFEAIVLSRVLYLVDLSMPQIQEVFEATVRSCVLYAMSLSMPQLQEMFMAIVLSHVLYAVHSWGSYASSVDIENL